MNCDKKDCRNRGFPKEDFPCFSCSENPERKVNSAYTPDYVRMAEMKAKRERNKK